MSAPPPPNLPTLPPADQQPVAAPTAPAKKKSRSVSPLMATGLFLIFFGTQLGQNAALSIVLQKTGSAGLPRLYMLNAVALCASAFFASRMMTSYSIRRVLLGLFGLGLLLVEGVRWAYALQQDWAPGALYILAYGLGDLLGTFFWALAQQVYDARGAKRSFPIVSAAGTLGGALSGFLARELATSIGTVWLLDGWAVTLLMGLVWTSFAARRLSAQHRALAPSARGGTAILPGGDTAIMRKGEVESGRLDLLGSGVITQPLPPPDPVPVQPAAGAGNTGAHSALSGAIRVENTASLAAIRAESQSSPTDVPLARAIGIGLVFVVTVTLFGRYLYGRALDETFEGHLDKITEMNGLLIGFSSLLTLLAQLLAAPFILQRFGVGVAGVLYPVLMGGAFAGLYWSFGLTAAVTAYFGITTVRFGVQGLVETMLFTPLPPEISARMTVLATGLGLPLGMALTGIGLEVLKAYPPQYAAIAGGLAALSLLLMALLRDKAYSASLRSRLLKGGSDLRVRYASLIEEGGADLKHILAEQLDPNDPEILDRLLTLARAKMRQASTPQQTTLLRKWRGEPWRTESPLGKVVETRLRECYRLRVALENLPGITSPKGVESLWRGAIRHRLSENLSVILAALKAGTLHPDYDRISSRVLDADPRIRAAAVEILDGLLPDDLRPLILPLLEEARFKMGLITARNHFGPEHFEGDPVKMLLSVPDDWVCACTFYAVAHIDPRAHEESFKKGARSADKFLSFASQFGLYRLRQRGAG